MSTLAVYGLVALVIVGLIWALVVQARSAGSAKADAQATQAKETADAAQRMAAAEAAGPHTGDDALDRLRDHSA